MPTITFRPSDKIVEVPSGTLIHEAALLAGVELAAPCGNQGRCGRCLVNVEAGSVHRRDNAHLSTEQSAAGWALACQAEIVGDAVIAVPEQRLREQLVSSKTTWRAAAVSAVAISDSPPLVQKQHLSLPPPDLTDSVSDWDRVRREVERLDEGVPLTIDLLTLRGLARQLRDADWSTTAVIHRGCTPGSSDRLIAIENGDTTDRVWGLAVDIGTTTVAAHLVDLRSRSIVASAAEHNAQIACGEDIISRIIYSRQGNGQGLTHLQGLAVETINLVVAEACEQRGVDPREIYDVVVAGNTTMMHLFLRLDPQHIRSEPYVPTANRYPMVRADEIGLKAHPMAAVWCYPSVAAYVGGDITSGAISSGLFRTDKLTLFMDVGTNGELVLGNAEWLVTCACSAGPAFEGAGVQHGMRATIGAIEDVTINTQTLEPTVSVLGEGLAAGICGSGMIAALAEMFITGVLDRQGRIDLPRLQARMADPRRIREGDHGNEYVLVWKEQSAIGEDIVLTEVDVTSLIRTKAAVYAGIMSLVNSVGLSLSDIEEVLIGGAFGQHIDVEQAIRIGLLPDLPWDRFKFLGNTSVLGAYQALISSEVREWAEEVAQRMTYLELIADNRFMDEYTSAMFLPHTDLEAFPTVKAALAEA